MKTLVFIGNDKKGREFLHDQAQNYSVLFALNSGSHSLKRVYKLLKKGSLTVPILMKMTWAELLRPYHTIPRVPRIKTNDDLLAFIENNKVDQVILYHVGLIIRRRVLQTGAKVINIHCARLPKYAGLMAIQRALSSDDLQQAATLHVVNEQVDAGEVIDTIPFQLDPNKSYKENEDAAFQAGQILLENVLKKYRIEKKD